MIFRHASLALVLGLACQLAAAGKPPQMQVHLVFSNHLDIGFDGIDPLLGYDNTVINTYFSVYFPRALNLSDWMSRHGGSDRYRYTTQSYLLSLFLDCPSGMGLECPDAHARQEVRQGIANGSITWHAFPHNTQVEFMDVPLLQFGVQLTHDLDSQFNKAHKITMSQRDVPGLTRAAIPALKASGVHALSVGVNAGSAPPAVPFCQPFWWLDPESGERILAFWHPGGYGGWHDGIEMDGYDDCIKARGLNHVLCVAWRGDNSGPPPTVEEVQKVYNFTRQQFPGANVFASTLDDYVNELRAAAPALSLPVVTAELGDTWIHGVQSDPRRTADFRAVLRARRRFLAGPGANPVDPLFYNFSRMLLKVPEHTWGLDVKKGLNDFNNYTNVPFHACLRNKCANYEALILSWKRQNRYTDWALQALGSSGNHPVQQAVAADIGARTAAAQIKDLTSQPGYSRLSLQPGGRYNFAATNGWAVQVTAGTGKLTQLQYRGETDWASSADAAMAQLLYSVYNESSYDVVWRDYAYQPQYLKDWFEKDFGKPGLTDAGWHLEAESTPELVAAYHRQLKADQDTGFELHLKFRFPDILVKEAGAPAAAWLVLLAEPGAAALQLTAVWQNKTPTRVPEALWVRFKPANAAADPHSWIMHKLDGHISPGEVIFNGSHTMHAVQDDGVSVLSQSGAQRLQIRSLDSSLVSPGHPNPFPSAKTWPDMTQGMAFNLANNIWGTNYVMWTPWSAEDVSLAFRFELLVKELPLGARHPPRQRVAHQPDARPDLSSRVQG